MKIQQILHFDEDNNLPLDMTFIGKWNAEKDLPLRSLLTNEQQSKQIDNSYDAEEKKREKDSRNNIPTG